jgi:hypothetical protein
MIYLAQAIFSLHPEAIRTSGEDAFDANGNPIAYDRDAVEQLAEQMAAQQNRSYTAFWDALLASTVYGSIRTQSMASLPMNTLATEFIALLGDAKAGRPNEAAIQASMSAVFSTGTFTEADAAEFTAALAGGHLDDTYTLGSE